MASLSLKHIYKVYDGTTKAVNDFNMEIRDKEFIVFVGPSGCGKSTTLRMIAGLEDISAGELRIDDVIVNDVEPGDRNIAMVFQNYALYPHMTVYENMAFALKTAKVPKHIIHEKVTEAARILGITEYLERKPKALSGGQRQRVALGRAIVRSPKVFLLDEPLSNLDAKLRAAMRAEITRLHERLGTTFIYVTHDQVEAMTMGSRIVVMRGGFVQQIDTPKNLYNHPANLFVAGFIGTPRMNFWHATLKKEGDTVCIRLDSGSELTVRYDHLNRVQTRYMDGNRPVTLGVRPDDVIPWREGMNTAEWARLPATVTVVEALGGETLVYGHLGVAIPDDTPVGEGAEEEVGQAAGRDTVIMKAPAEFEACRGDVLDMAVNLRKLHLFDRETENSIMPVVPAENVCDCTVENGLLIFAAQRFSLPPALRDTSHTTPPSTPHDATLTLPTDALLLGTGSGRAQVAEVESISTGGVTRTLYRLTVGGETVFATESGEPRFRVGDALPFDPDFSRITVEAAGDTATGGDSTAGILPLPSENTLKGRFTKEKETDDRGRRVYRFYLEVEDLPVAADGALCEKLFSCKGTAIFRTSLEYRFPPDAVTVKPRGKDDEKTALLGRVTRILDYGRVVYAEIGVGSETVIAPYNGKAGDAVALIIDQSRLTVVDAEADIIIV